MTIPKLPNKVNGQWSIPANQILKRGQVKLTNLPTREYDRSKDIQAAKDGDPDAQARVKMIDSIKARHNRDKRK